MKFEDRTQKSYQEEMHRQFVRAELEKSKIEAADPHTKWLTQNDIMTKLKQQREGRHDL
jgi:hypothetical protein